MGGERVHRILIVEDESHLAEGLRFNLEAEGYAVEIAGDGPAGEKALNEASEPFGLVILDVMLPGMSGFELAQRIRAAGNFVPILILTAKDAAQDLIRGIEDGDDSGARPLCRQPWTVSHGVQLLRCHYHRFSSLPHNVTGPGILHSLYSGILG